jgi:glycosyltransferase involved in cell wall biosynthesis
VTPLVVNGRFLAGRPTGLHRTARSLLAAALGQGLDAAVIAPAGTDDPLVGRTLPSSRGRAGGQVFEQVLLPAAAGRRPILSLTNTAPLAARRSAVMVHDLAPLVGPQWFAGSMRAYRLVVTRAALRAELVLTVSTPVAAELADLGVDPARIAVVPPALDPLFFPAPDADVARVRDRLALHGPYLLLVGWADPRKDLATALAAHRTALRAVDHRLVLVGGTHPAFAPVSAPVEQGVLHAGYVSDGELRALLTGAAALLYPTRYEGFGLPPLEARACGTPALVSDLPVLRESGGDAGIYLPPGDVAAWTEAVIDVLRAPPPAPAPAPRSWDAAAAELRSALRRLDEC